MEDENKIETTEAQEGAESQEDSFLDGWNEEGGEPEGGETPAVHGEPEGEKPGGVKGIPGRLGGEAAVPWSGGLSPQMRADVQAFAAAFPEAARNYRSIPPEVWAAVDRGTSLTAAYARYSGAREAARLQAEESVRRRARQDAWNAAASTGSMRSAGSPRRKDPFLEGWEEG